eukprot:1175724-Prorocentrum_minimum.AAC.1
MSTSAASHWSIAGTFQQAANERSPPANGASSQACRLSVTSLYLSNGLSVTYLYLSGSLRMDSQLRKTLIWTSPNAAGARRGERGGGGARRVARERGRAGGEADGGEQGAGGGARGASRGGLRGGPRPGSGAGRGPAPESQVERYTYVTKSQVERYTYVTKSRVERYTYVTARRTTRRRARRTEASFPASGISSCPSSDWFPPRVYTLVPPPIGSRLGYPPPVKPLRRTLALDYPRCGVIV